MGIDSGADLRGVRGHDGAAVTTIACVMRSGGHYQPHWAWKLKRGLRRHAGTDFRFVVLTDLPAAFGVWGIPMLYRWPKWWGKLELFRPGLFSGPVLYLDLDTLAVGSLDGLLAYRGPFAMISDFYRPKLAQSGVMAWTPGEQSDAIWHAFAQDPARHINRYRGDGEFIRDHVDAVRLQDEYPGQIVSFKVHAKRKAPPGARLVCGHGLPRWDMPQAAWAHRQWVST